MSSSFFKHFIFLIILIFIIPIIITFLFVPSLSSNINITKNIINNTSSTNSNSSTPTIQIDTDSFVWPTPGYTTISSPFGRRNSPTRYASSFHKGIDIAAPTGTNIVAVQSGRVILAEFNGSGGCTVIINSNSYQFIYCHVSPTFLVHKNQYVNKGELIAKVGPKNVYGFANNPYRDSSGRPTNGATTGAHLHFSIKKDGVAVNPLNFY